MFTAMIPKKYYRQLKCTCIKFAVLFLLITENSLGQKPVFTPGIIGGLNTSQVSGDDLFGFNQFGVYGGLCLNAQVDEKKSFQFQIAFSQKGSRKPPDANGTPSLYILRLNYIDVPLFYSHRFQKDKIKHFQGEIGLINSYLMNYSEKNIFGDVIPARPFKKYEGSLMIGMGYWISEGFYFSTRLTNSILPIREHMSGATYYFNRGQYNTVVQFSFQYFFQKKSK